MLFTTTNCLICHTDLTEQGVDIEKLAKSFDIFCKVLNVEKDVNFSLDVTQENCPFCPNCLSIVEEVFISYDLIETIQSKIQTVTNKVVDIVKEVSFYDCDDRTKQFRSQVLRDMQGARIILPNTRRIFNKIETPQDSENSDMDDGEDFFDSFISNNVERLKYAERLAIELQQQQEQEEVEVAESGSDFEYDGNYENSGNEALSDDDEIDEPSRRRPGPKCSKPVERIRNGRRQLTEISSGQYSYAGITIVKTGDLVQCMNCPEKNFKLISETAGHIEIHHLGSKEKKRLFPCQICGQLLPRKKLKPHNESHVRYRNKRRHKCKICLTILKSLDELKKHLEEEHVEIHEESLLEVPPLPPRINPTKTPDGNLNYMGIQITSGNDKFFRCTLCPDKGPYSTRQLVLSHVRHTHIDPPKEGQQTNFGSPVTVINGLFSCDLCPDRAPYRGRRSIISHIKDKHLERQAPWLKCETCHKEYRTLTALNIHRKTHQNTSYNLFCDSCGKFFNSEFVLYHHKKQVHDGIVPQKRFACSYEGCEKRYGTEKSLEIHFRLHTGELPFVCEYCNQRFRQHKMKMVHYRRKHAMETPFKCNFCTEAFHDSTFVQSHLKSKHPEVTDRRKGLAYHVIYNITPTTT